MTRLRCWAPKGERLIDKVPQGRWKTTTLLAALWIGLMRPACSMVPWRALSRLRRAVSCPDSQARRRRDPRQPRLTDTRGSRVFPTSFQAAPKTQIWFVPLDVERLSAFVVFTQVRRPAFAPWPPLSMPRAAARTSDSQRNPQEVVTPRRLPDECNLRKGKFRRRCRSLEVFREPRGPFH